MSLNNSKDADCILCRKPARFLVGFDYTPFECERCGRFKMSFECANTVAGAWAGAFALRILLHAVEMLKRWTG